MKEIFKIEIGKINLYETVILLCIGFMGLLYFQDGLQLRNVGLFAIILIVLLIVPRLIYPATWTLLFVGKLLNKIIPAILLTIVFFLIVTPIGLIRSAMKIDSLNLKKFKKGTHSVFIVKDKFVHFEDIKQPF